MIVTSPVVSLRTIGLPSSVICWAVEKVPLLNVIVSAPPSALARFTAWRRLRSPNGEPVPSIGVLTSSEDCVWKAPMSGWVGSSGVSPRWSEARYTTAPMAGAANAVLLKPRTTVSVSPLTFVTSTSSLSISSTMPEEKGAAGDRENGVGRAGGRVPGQG